MTKPRAATRLWTQDETDVLYELIGSLGIHAWTAVSRQMSARGFNRTGEQCRARFAQPPSTGSLRPWSWEYVYSVCGVWSRAGHKRFDQRWNQGRYQREA